MTDVDSTLPAPCNVVYPIRVVYCGECSLPLEYCEYAGTPDKCRKWLETNLPEMLEGVEVKDGEQKDEKEVKKHTKRGGKGIAKSDKAEKKVARVSLQRAPRGKTKSMTVVKGLATFDIDLKVAAKFFAGRFACGASVTGADEIVIQGDVKDELFDLIPEKWSHVDEDAIDDLGDLKR